MNEYIDRFGNVRRGIKVHRKGDTAYQGEVINDLGTHATIQWRNGTLTHTLWSAMVLIP